MALENKFGLTSSADLAREEERLNAFEKMLSAILVQYDSVTKKLAVLKAEGKEKTVTYRQLFTNKLQYQTILSYYRTYGLLDKDKK